MFSPGVYIQTHSINICMLMFDCVCVYVHVCVCVCVRVCCVILRANAHVWCACVHKIYIDHAKPK